MPHLYLVDPIRDDEVLLLPRGGEAVVASVAGLAQLCRDSVIGEALRELTAGARRALPIDAAPGAVQWLARRARRDAWQMLSAQDAIDVLDMAHAYRCERLIPDAADAIAAADEADVSSALVAFFLADCLNLPRESAAAVAARRAALPWLMAHHETLLAHLRAAPLAVEQHRELMQAIAHNLKQAWQGDMQAAMLGLVVRVWLDPVGRAALKIPPVALAQRLAEANEGQLLERVLESIYAPRWAVQSRGMFREPLDAAVRLASPRMVAALLQALIGRQESPSRETLHDLIRQARHPDVRELLQVVLHVADMEAAFPPSKTVNPRAQRALAEHTAVRDVLLQAYVIA